MNGNPDYFRFAYLRFPNLDEACAWNTGSIEDACPLPGYFADGAQGAPCLFTIERAAGEEAQMSWPSVFMVWVRLVLS